MQSSVKPHQVQNMTINAEYDIWMLQRDIIENMSAWLCGGKVYLKSKDVLFKIWSSQHLKQNAWLCHFFYLNEKYWIPV